MERVIIANELGWTLPEINAAPQEFFTKWWADREKRIEKENAEKKRLETTAGKGKGKRSRKKFV